MKQEDKELLLKDICARLPYGVIMTNIELPETYYQLTCWDLHDAMFDDDWDDESLNEKLNYLHRLIMQEIVDFCKRNNIDADYVALDADHLMDSINAGKWHPGTDSALVLFDKNKEVIIKSL